MIHSVEILRTSEPDRGRAEIGTDQIEVTLASGDVIAIVDCGDYIDVRNNGERGSSGLAISPRSGNVVEIRPFR